MKSIRPTEPHQKQRKLVLGAVRESPGRSDPAPDRPVNQQEPHVIASQQTTARPVAVVPQQRAPRTAPARATAPTPAPTPVPVPTTVPAGVNERKASAPQVELLAELPTGLLMRFNGTLHLAQPADVVPLYVTKPGLLR